MKYSYNPDILIELPNFKATLSFFEENLLIADAITYYNQALVLSPDPDGFNKLYDSFMVRNGLSR